MTGQLLIGDCRETLATLPAGCVQTCVTSPPYWGLRDYGHADQIGLEPTPEEYVANLVAVFREVRRALREDGTLWLNLGDSYAMSTKGSSGVGEKQITNAGTIHADRKWAIPTGLKPKDLVGIPWRVAFALQADGWWLRSDIVWSKPNPMPESVKDRPTRAHEFVFLLTKAERYYYDAEPLREPPTSRPQRRITQQAEHAKGRSEVCPYCLGTAEAFDPQTKEGPVCPACNGRGTAVAVTSSRPAYKASQRSEPGVLCNPNGRNARSVWTIQTSPYSGAHFATMPPELAQRCILAGSRVGDTVLDPFLGSGTTGQVAQDLGRPWIGCELQPAYEPLIRERTAQTALALESA